MTSPQQTETDLLTSARARNLTPAQLRETDIPHDRVTSVWIGLTSSSQGPFFAVYFPAQSHTQRIYGGVSPGPSPAQFNLSVPPGTNVQGVRDELDSALDQAGMEYHNGSDPSTSYLLSPVTPHSIADLAEELAKPGAFSDVTIANVFFEDISRQYLSTSSLPLDLRRDPDLSYLSRE